MKVLIVKFPYVELSFTEKICELAEKLEYDIAAILSLDLQEPCKTVKNYPVISLFELKNVSWDVIIPACREDTATEIVSKMIELGIGDEEQFKTRWWLLKQFMTQKYAEVQDPDIQATLEHWKTHSMTVFNQHIDTKKVTGHRIFFDDPCGLPYIGFRTVGGDIRKMFFRAIL
ncbi:MAG: hypothetical protein IKE46_12225 [Selenomonadaceae bacterium]|nr:hypothetical protein [Selenomonadaceae bacterium]